MVPALKRGLGACGDPSEGRSIPLRLSRRVAPQARRAGAIYNPDGSEAEKSGNGLRIFARYLHATGKTKKKHFTVETKGGLVTIDLHIDRHGDASAVTVEMGQATFKPAALPCTLAA